MEGLRRMREELHSRRRKSDDDIHATTTPASCVPRSSQVPAAGSDTVATGSRRWPIPAILSPPRVPRNRPIASTISHAQSTQIQARARSVIAHALKKSLEALSPAAVPPADPSTIATGPSGPTPVISPLRSLRHGLTGSRGRLWDRLVAGRISFSRVNDTITLLEVSLRFIVEAVSDGVTEIS